MQWRCLKGGCAKASVVRLGVHRTLRIFNNFQKVAMVFNWFQGLGRWGVGGGV